MVITIAGGYGCGGKHIAKLAAEKLGYRFCDDEIVSEAVRDNDLNMPEETFRYYDEGTGTAPLSEMTKLGAIQRGGYFSAIDSLVHDVMPLDRGMTALLQDVLNRLADEGNCVLLGRCANHFLAGRKDLLSVYVMDEEDNCVSRIMESHPGLSEKEARKLIKKTNRRRADYYSFFTGKRFGDMGDFAMVLNCGLLGVENAAEILRSAVAAGLQQ